MALISHETRPIPHILTQCQQLSDDTGDDLDLDDDVDGSFRLNVAKVLVECELFEQAAEMTDTLLCEDDSSAELWYVSGVALRGSGDLALGTEHMTRCRKVIKKQLKCASSGQQDVATDGDGSEATLRERLAHVEQMIKEMKNAAAKVEDTTTGGGSKMMRD